MTERARVPHATYRLQLNQDFTFAHARALVPYLQGLGVSHAYLSPILKARPGSTHGYDTVDHRQIDPALGTLAQFRDLALALRAAELGIVLDFVPNHMGIGDADNGLWLDVLRNGPGSRFADWFDIDWSPPSPQLQGKLLVPFLGAPYAQALVAGDIVLGGNGELAVWAHREHKLPIRPEDSAELLDQYGDAAAIAEALNGCPGEPDSWAALDGLIARQHWRLAHFATASDEINYRRFFTNNDLAGIRVERPDVFDHVHALIFSLIDEGLVEGLRIDHIDGLRDPKGYIEQLRDKVPRPIYLVVEKILAPHEQLRSAWPVDGTTGYEFGALLTRLLVDPGAQAGLTRTYRRFAGIGPDAPRQTYLCKLQIMDTELASELFALARGAAKLARSVRVSCDLTENGLRKGLREIIAWLAVYRTYCDDGPIDGHDRREIGEAVAKARRGAPSHPPAIFDFLERLLTRDLPSGYDLEQVRAIIARFQQYTGPVMAKGLEDTALYRDNRLVALNEVGAHPEIFCVGIDAFHDANRRRLAVQPFTLLTTSTHDTKRGEDTRARIGAIADQPQFWNDAVFAWRDLLAADGAAGIDDNDLYLFFQLLVGAWPAGHMGRPSAPALRTLTQRLQGAMIKSVREARVNSDWGVNNTLYEATMSDFMAAALRNTAFVAALAEAERVLGPIGRRKGLIQTALKLTVPGVPDIYRGAEDWEQSLLDPDNRRPVDFKALRIRLDRIRAGGKTDPGDAKLVLTARLLDLRRRDPDLFLKGRYVPMQMGRDNRLLAFQRTHGARALLVLADLSPGHEGIMGAPMALPPGRFADILTGERFEDCLISPRTLQQLGTMILLAETS